MKKFLFFLLILTLLFTVVACNQDDATEQDRTASTDNATHTCEHQWEDATCTTPKTCSLCHVTDGNALGHTQSNAVEENRVDAACNKDGSYDSVVYCSVCDAELSRTPETIPATEKHTAAEAVEENRIEATCDKDGSYDSVVYCSLCGNEISRTPVTIPAEHSPATAVKENTKAATCDKPGSYDSVVYCAVCNNELSRTPVEVPATGLHTPKTAVKENTVSATCGENGSYERVVYCSVCNGEISRDHVTVPATGKHTQLPAVEENRIDATCTASGSYDSVVYCSVCQKEASRTTVTIPASHTKETIPGKAVTCTASGLTDGVKCSVCSTVLVPQKEIPAAHAYGDWVVTTPPTQTTVGSQKKTCARCGDEVVEEIAIKGEITYSLNDSTEGIKILGERHATGTSYITADWSCSGIELNAILYSRSSVTFYASANANCYFKVFVDGVVYQNGSSDYFTVTTQHTAITLENLPAGEHVIRLIKVTGYTLAQAQIYAVKFSDGRMDLNAPAEKDLYIEFLGDSISCGWGTIGDHTGAYTDQDGSLAYPYKLAEKLNADYSITALSGCGVIYGSLNFDKNYLDASPSRSNEKYGFERQADIVVINLGTNERGNNASAEEFEEGYLRLLRNVFQKNGDDCVVYCLWGAMNDAYNPKIKNAIERYLEENPDARIYTFALRQSSVAGGAPSWGHPSEGDNKIYTMQLEAYINSTYYES